MKLFDVVRPDIAPVCRKVYDLVSSGNLKIQPEQIEIYGTKILFNGNPVPVVTIVGDAVHCTWPQGATIDVDRLPDRLDPSVQRLEIYHNRAVIVTGYGRVILRS